MMKWWLAAVLLASGFAMAASSARQELDAALRSVPDPQRGATTFEQCASCHGADGAGQVSGTVPRIAGQHYRVLVRQIVDFRHGKRWDYRMEGVAASHALMSQPQDIADVAFHVSRMSRDGAPGVGDGQFVERGASIYAGRCASCHGARGEGDDRQQVPRLAGQHASYLSRQIYDAVDGRRPPLARSHGKWFKPLVFEDVLGVSDYLARLGLPELRAASSRFQARTVCSPSRGGSTVSPSHCASSIMR